MFGVEMCDCAVDEREEEVLDGVVFDANCKGVVGLERKEAGDGQAGAD